MWHVKLKKSQLWPLFFNQNSPFYLQITYEIIHIRFLLFNSVSNHPIPPNAAVKISFLKN